MDIQMKVNLYSPYPAPPGTYSTAQVQLPNKRYPEKIYYDPQSIWINVPRNNTVVRERFNWNQDKNYIVVAKVGYNQAGLLTAGDIYVVAHADESK